MRGDIVGIEVDERVAGSRHDRRLLTRGVKPSPFQLDRVQTDVQQHLDALGGRDCQRVVSRVEHDRLPRRKVRKSDCVTGSSAMPSPTIFWENTGSGTRSIGMICPESGAFNTSFGAPVPNAFASSHRSLHRL